MPFIQELYNMVKHHQKSLTCLVPGAATIIISLLTEPIPAEKLYRLTFWTRRSTEVRNGFDDEVEEEAAPEKVHHDDDEAEVTGCRRILYMICGISRQKNQASAPKPPKKSREEEAQEAAEFLHEKSSLKILVNIAAVLSMSLACFVVAFYA